MSVRLAWKWAAKSNEKLVDQKYATLSLAYLDAIYGIQTFWIIRSYLNWRISIFAHGLTKTKPRQIEASAVQYDIWHLENNW